MITQEDLAAAKEAASDGLKNATTRTETLRWLRVLTHLQPESRPSEQKAG